MKEKCIKLIKIQNLGEILDQLLIQIKKINQKRKLIIQLVKNITSMNLLIKFHNQLIRKTKIIYLHFLHSKEIATKIFLKKSNQDQINLSCFINLKSLISQMSKWRYFKNLQNRSLYKLKENSFREKKQLLKFLIKNNKKFKIILKQIQKQVKQYPKDWQPQYDQNFIKVPLQPEGTIYEIYRIQNKSLWDNYIIEKNKLIEIYKQQNEFLKRSKSIYGMVQEISILKLKHLIRPIVKQKLFQNNPQVGLWGAGIYFAENASYYRNFSYQLKQQDDSKNVGKLVFLCCLVTTGKVEIKQQDNSIKRPSQGYDCVSGFTNGSNVFILYSMDIRRAYPAYEIVYS
ncbi:unnamed protein product [Paramecium sonneborni]|uniref:PARP catalytic domain-containing protein n=1 Tax=Paramecium sonneborni TaxID=65129 RepID=A0A8S1QL56_9CILI|nr:unnamed protein product [Paramecium sonneborni]